MFYYNTDSVIYRWKAGQASIETGDYLGQMTDEVEDDNGVALTEVLYATVWTV